MTRACAPNQHACTSSDRPRCATRVRKALEPDRLRWVNLQFISYDGRDLDTVAGQCLHLSGRSMSTSSMPSEREAIVLAILLNRERYGREIRDEYQSRSGRSMPLGSLYVTLTRMEDKDFLLSRDGATTHERGGNRRKYFRLSAKGRRALQQYEIRLTSIRSALSGPGIGL